MACYHVGPCGVGCESYVQPPQAFTSRTYCPECAELRQQLQDAEARVERYRALLDKAQDMCGRLLAKEEARFGCFGETDVSVTREDLIRLWTEKVKAQDEARPYEQRAEEATRAYWAAYDEYHKGDAQKAGSTKEKA